MKSFGYAISGILHAIKHERNFRIHLCVMAYVLFFAWFGEVSKQQIPILLLAFGLVLSAELFNTAVERICDLVCPEKSPLVKIIKDVAAGAVLCTAIMAAAAGLWIFCDPKVLFLVLSKFAENPYIPLLGTVSIVFAVLLCRVKK